MKDAIGGYFGLELRKGEHYHRNALRLNTGRNCFEYILRARAYTHVYIPYYTCEVMLEPLQKLHIPYSFYAIDSQLEPSILPDLEITEAFLYTNYYGLKQNAVERLAAYYGSQLIVDNSQAFFAPHLTGIDTFYTARKFFGVADGAYLYTDQSLELVFPIDSSAERMSHLLKRLDGGAECGFSDFQEHEEELCNQPIRKMSNLTDRILESINYEAVKEQRKANYMFIEKALHNSNRLALDLGDAVPMVYPYWTEKGEELRHQMKQQRIYTATYWPNILQWDTPLLERTLALNLLPLPIDQRNNTSYIETILNLLI